MNQTQITPKYFIEEDLEAIENSNSFLELQKVAVAVLERMPDPIIGLADPFSTSRKDSDLTLFNKTTIELCNFGVNLFNEIPFQKKIQDLKIDFFQKNPSKDICDSLTREFFGPLLETGKIKTLLCLPQYESFFGSYWMTEVAIRIKKIEIIYFPENFTEANFKKIPGLAAVRP
jgi:hypothetical protein